MNDDKLLTTWRPYRRNAAGRRAAPAMRHSPSRRPRPQGDQREEEIRQTKPDLRHAAVALLLVAVAGLLAAPPTPLRGFEGLPPASQSMWSATPMPRQGPMADYRRAKALCATIPMPDREMCRRDVEAKYRWLREIRGTVMTPPRPAES